MTLSNSLGGDSELLRIVTERRGLAWSEWQSKTVLELSSIRSALMQIFNNAFPFCSVKQQLVISRLFRKEFRAVKGVSCLSRSIPVPEAQHYAGKGVRLLSSARAVSTERLQQCWLVLGLEPAQGTAWMCLSLSQSNTTPGFFYMPSRDLLKIPSWKRILSPCPPSEHKPKYF